MKKLLIILAFFSLPLMGQNYDTSLVKDINGNLIIDNNGVLIHQNIPLYNLDAIAYFEREYQQPPTAYKEEISIAFDELDPVLDKIQLLYVFYGYSDSSTMHSWVSDHAISYPTEQKPYFFRNSGIEGIQYGNFVDMAYANSNFNLNSEGVDSDSMTIGVYLGDLYKDNIVSIQFGAYDGSTRMQVQHGRPITAGQDGYTRFLYYNTLSDFVSVVDNTYDKDFHYVRKGDSINVYRQDSKIFASTRTVTGVPDLDIYLAGVNSNGSLLNTPKTTISYFYIADYLTSTEVSIIANALENYLSAFLAEDMIFDNDYVQYKVNRAEEINNPAILYQDGNKKMMVENDTVYLSLDGATFPYKINLPITREISSGYIWGDNSVSIFHNDLTVYYSNDSLTTLNVASVLEKDGTTCLYHTPVNAAYPGAYFKTLSSVKSGVIDGNEIGVLPQYGNISGGASRVIAWFSADTGKSWRIGYEFGQNPNETDNGTSTGGTGGNLLGDASNPILSRHIHDITFVEDSILFCSGDAIDESKWFRSYFINDSTWSTDTLAGYTLAGRFKTGGMHWEDDSITFGADDNLGKNDYGVFRTAYEDITTTGNHRILNSISSTTWNLYERDDVLIQTSFENHISVSTDNGATWTPRFLLEELNTGNSASQAYTNITPADGDGWYSVSDNTRALNLDFMSGTILIKLK